MFMILLKVCPMNSNRQPLVLVQVMNEPDFFTLSTTYFFNSVPLVVYGRLERYRVIFKSD